MKQNAKMFERQMDSFFCWKSRKRQNDTEIELPEIDNEKLQNAKRNLLPQMLQIESKGHGQIDNTSITDIKHEFTIFYIFI